MIHSNIIYQIIITQYLVNNKYCVLKYLGVSHLYSLPQKTGTHVSSDRISNETESKF